jgi:hypothetical protein
VDHVEVRDVDPELRGGRADEIRGRSAEFVLLVPILIVPA